MTGWSLFIYLLYFLTVLLKIPTWNLSDVITSRLNLNWWSRQFPCMHCHVTTTYMLVPSQLVTYPLRKFRLTLLFNYWWLWHIYILMFYHLLSAEFSHIWLVNFCLLFICLHAVSCTFYSYLHAWFNYTSLYIHAGLDFFFVLSATMCCVLQYAIDILLLLTLSLANK